MGDFLALIFGLSFAVLLCIQPLAIFLGVLERATSVMQFIREADLWVASQDPPQIDMFRGLGEQELQRVRSVPGVAWAQPGVFILIIVMLIIRPNGLFGIGEVRRL